MTITEPRPFGSWDHILTDISTLTYAVFQRPESPQIHDQEQYKDTFQQTFPGHCQHFKEAI